MGTRVVQKIRHGSKSPFAWQMTFHPIPHTPWFVGYFPKGPTPTKEMMSVLRNIAREQHAISIQLEPNTRESEFHTPLSSLGLIPSHRELFTKHNFLLDLTQSEKDLMARMHSKTRYNIRVAERHGVTIAEDNSDRAFAEYLRLSQETTSRQGFYAHDEHYHRTMWKEMSAAGIAHLFTASYQGKTLAAWIIFRWGDTIYYPYGASSRDNREVMAPTLLLWKIALWGKSHGAKTFDLWGALGPAADPRDPWYGFHRFKEGFAPEAVTYIGSYDFVTNPLAYRIYCIADSLRWMLLRLKRRIA
jgi:lipid II:glycine glycyltransferase (peptidoglycan interpeptide bridge formation enzyme)